MKPTKPTGPSIGGIPMPFEFHSVTISESALSSWHYDTEFILFTGGKGTIRCVSNLYNIKKGDIFAISSGKIHVVDPMPGKTVTCVYIIPDRDFFACLGIDTAAVSFEECIHNQEAIQRFLDIENAISKAQVSHDYTSSARCIKAMLDFLIYLCDNFAVESSLTKGGKASTTDYIRETVRYIIDNSSKNINLDDLSAHIGLSKFHLVREFKKYTGNTIITYVNAVKCHEAERYIINGMSVEEAAFASGFNSVSHFSKTYKKITGSSPITIKRSTEK